MMPDKPNGDGLTLWLTGLSGAGKSTLARGVRSMLVSRGYRVEILDGDQVRRRLSRDLGFSRDDRNANVLRIGYMARLLARNGVVAIVAAISPYREARDEVRREHETAFVEVFVDCPLDELVRRDTKGLYRRALSGELQNFTGVSDPYEAPLAPELTVRTDLEQVDESVARIVECLERRALVVSR